MTELTFYQLLNLVDKATLYAESRSSDVKILDNYPEPHEVVDSPQLVANKKIGDVTCLPSSIFNQIVDLAVALDDCPSPSLQNMRAEIRRLNALARKYRAALEEIELNSQVDAVAIAKEVLKE